MDEQWKDIKGYEGLYQISSFGRVKSLKRKVQHGNYSYTRKERFLVCHEDKYGYLIIGLNKDKEHKTMKVHRLVAEAFIENPKGLQIVNHKDFNRTNNEISNLEWCDCQYNAQYSRERRPLMITKKNPGATKEKYIYLCENRFRVQIRNRSVRITKRFSTLEEAIVFRNEVVNELGYSI